MEKTTWSKILSTVRYDPSIVLKSWFASDDKSNTELYFHLFLTFAKVATLAWLVL